MKTLIVAEPGCTAEGDYDRMVRLLETAHACGADAWKPQWVSDPDAMCARRHIGPDHPHHAYYRRAYGWLAWPAAWHEEFRDRCHARGLRYACTAFLPQDVAVLAPWVDVLKVSSFEVDDPAIWAAIPLPPRPYQVIASYGMNGHGGRAVDHTLHCVTAYPAPTAAMRLWLVGTRYDGLSDHSRHPITGAVAVGRGATLIETHYRLDDCDPANPDYAVAWSPTEFAQYVRNIRDAEIMIGPEDAPRGVQDCERWALSYRV